MASRVDVLLERISNSDIISSVDGINGLLALTKDNLYMVRGGMLERKVVKTYSLKSISSIELKKPGLMFNGHFQIITSGNSDRTKRSSSAFDYARDENTVMIRTADYETFLEFEKLVYKQRDKSTININQVAATKEPDAFEKLEKLAKLKEQRLISDEEYEDKRKKLLSEI